MNIELLAYTPDALDILLMTKQTRLDFKPGLLEEIRSWPWERKMEELRYMRGTIQSSWEFVDYTFLIDGVSRAFTHQFVRTRQGSYAQQSQRTVDMSGFPYVVPRALQLDSDMPLVYTNEYGVEFDDLNPDMVEENAGWLTGEQWYHWTMLAIEKGYRMMREHKINPQDARGVLPTNVATNIIAKFSLRTLSEMAKLRLCTRTQGEYQDVFREIRRKVIAVHPWAEEFIEVHCVALGVCAFPNYAECPIKGPIFNPETGERWDGIHIARPANRQEIKAAWERVRFEATPQAQPARSS